MFANHNTTDIYKKKIEKGNDRENITGKSLTGTYSIF